MCVNPSWDRGASCNLSDLKNRQRNPKFGLWTHLGVTECRMLFRDHCGLDFWPQFLKNMVENGLSVKNNVP